MFFDSSIIWVAVLLFLLGMIAFVIEAVIFPGFGVSGIIGIILVGWGVYLISSDFIQTTEALVLAIAVSIVFLIVGVRMMTRYKVWHRLSLQNKQENEEGYVAPAPELKRYVEKEGFALTPLRPAGTAEIDGDRLDVVTAGDFIAKDAKVKVVEVEGLRVVVKEITD